TEGLLAAQEEVNRRADAEFARKCPRLAALADALTKNEIGLTEYLEKRKTAPPHEIAESERISNETAREFKRLQTTKYKNARQIGRANETDVDELGPGHLVCRDSAGVVSQLLRRADVPHSYVGGTVQFGGGAGGSHAFIVLPEQRAIVETTLGLCAESL